MTAHSRNIALLAELFEPAEEPVETKCLSCDKPHVRDPWRQYPGVCMDCIELGYPFGREYEPPE